MTSTLALPNLPTKLRARASGMARAGQVISSFAAVTAIYWLYWLLAVPMIEPNVERRPTAERVSDEEINQARQNVSLRQREVAKHFPADAWEGQGPAMWESDQTRLLFKSLNRVSEDTVELQPCTVMMFSKNDATAPPIIMRALEGAEVQFDQPIVLKSFDPNKCQMIGGRLKGEIRIYRNESQPGKGDDLETATHDVLMKKDRVWTEHQDPVHFRLGRNRGVGRELEILLTSSEGGLRGGSMRTLQLKRDVKVQLDLSDNSSVGGAAAKPQPLDITCQGPFEFDMQRYAASFRDQVDLFWPNPGGESDQMNCEVLTTYFHRGGAKPAASGVAARQTPAAPATQSSMNVRLIQARGNPVTVRAPSQGIYVRCPGLDYAPAPAGAVGSLVALGPGLLQGHLPNDPTGKYSASWAREFRFEPDGPQHKATLRGAAVVQLDQMGKITADELFAWLKAKSPVEPERVAGVQPVLFEGAAGAPANPTLGAGWQLERVLARVYPDKSAPSQGQVVIDAPQLHGTTAKLELRVERPPATLAGGPPVADGKAPPPARAPAAKTGRAPQNPTQRFDVRGGAIEIDLVPRGEDLAISNVTIDQQARLEEISPTSGGEKPLLVHGDRLRVEHADTEATHVTISGKPGVLEGGGITLWGDTIELEKQNNLLRVPGPGRMTMPMTQDLNGQPLARVQSMVVTWKQRMDFQSNTVVYLGDVAVKLEHQFLATEKLEAILNRPIDFSNPNAGARGTPDEKPQVNVVRCHGKAFLESRQFDDVGQQSAFDQMEALDLAVDRTTGAISGLGPGRLTHVGRGSNQALLSGAGGGEALRAAPPPPVNDNSLTYINVKFRKTLEGNLYRRQVTFSDRTKTVYGPVANWNGTLDPDDLASLGPRGMVLESRELEVRELAQRSKRDRGWFELQARGNVQATGTQFTAQGDRLTYSEEKDQIVLRGDGLSPAEVFREDPNGGPRQESKANELTYWLSVQRVMINGARFFNGVLPSKPAKDPAKPAVK